MAKKTVAKTNTQGTPPNPAPEPANRIVGREMVMCRVVKQPLMTEEGVKVAGEVFSCTPARAASYGALVEPAEPAGDAPAAI